MNRHPFRNHRCAPTYARRGGLFEQLESRQLMSTYFVSASSGNDAYTGASDSAAFKTLQKAANSVKSGDTVYVRAGTYGTGMNLVGHSGGTSTAPIRFLADKGAVITHAAASGSNASAAAINVESTGGWFVIDGFTVRSDGSMTKAGIRSASSANVVVRNCDVSGAPTGIFASRSDNILVENNVSHDNTNEHGIYVNGSANYVIRGNTTYGNNWNGIHTNVMDGVNQVNSGGLIENNVVRGNKLAGMDLTGMFNGTVRNNLVYGNGRHAVVLQNTNDVATVACHDMVFVNNTFDARAASSGYAIQMSSASAQPSGSAWTGNDNNVTVFNNVLVGNSASSSGAVGDLASAVAASFRSDRNVVVDSFGTGGSQRSLASWRSATGEDANSVVSSAAALFVNPTAGDYHLKAGAPAIDAGVGTFNGKAAPALDAQSDARPQGAGYDIGYDEVAAATTTPPPAPAPADTTAPAVTGRAPAAGSTGVNTATNVTATFSEAVDAASVRLELRNAAGVLVPAATGYDPASRTLTLDPAAALDAGTTYTATLSGAKDAAGNVAATSSWSFSTAAATPAPAPGSGAAFFDDFAASTLSSAWGAAQYDAGGSVTVAGGTVSAKKTQVRSAQTVAGAVEGRVQFSSRWQAFGLATDLSNSTGNSWAIFGTKDTAGTLYARTNVNGTTQTVNLGATPAGMHTYRVEPVAGGGFNFLIDGARVASINQAIPAGAPVKLVMSDMVGESAFVADWVRAD